MRGRTRFAAPLAPALIAAALAAGCGGSGGGLAGTIPPGQATQLTNDLSRIQTAVNDGNCSLARSTVADFDNLVNQLPSTTGEDLKNALRAGSGSHLTSLIDKQCRHQPSGTTGLSGAQPPSTSTSTTTTTTSTSTTSTTASPGNGNGNANGHAPGHGNSGGTSPGGSNG